MTRSLTPRALVVPPSRQLALAGAVRSGTDQCHPVTRSTGAFRITHEHHQIGTAGNARGIAWRRTPTGRACLEESR